MLHKRNQVVARVELLDIPMFYAAVAAYSTLVVCTTLGYGVDGVFDLPTFTINVDGVDTLAYVDSLGQSEQTIDCVIISFFSEEDDMDACQYALVHPTDDARQWLAGPNVITEKLNQQSSFSSLSLLDKLKALEG